MSKYEAIAEFYDEFTGDVGYAELAQYVDSLLKKHGFKGKRLLDVACGTGSLTLELFKLGYDMIGCDESDEMLMAAREKTGFSPDILFINQRAQELDLYGDIDGAVSTLDSVNHITEKDELIKAFSRISLFMNRGGLFVFDVNTPYKHEKILGSNAFVIENEGVFCAWQNEYQSETGVVNMQLDFFIEDGGAYFRETQTITERAYSLEELTEMLKVSNFEVLALYDDRSFEPPKDTSDRIFIVAKNVKSDL